MSKLMQLESGRRRPQTQQARPKTTRQPLSFPTKFVERVSDDRCTGTNDLSFELGLDLQSSGASTARFRLLRHKRLIACSTALSSS